MDLRQKAQAIYTALAGRYGEPRWQAGEDPVDALIGTILSANTNDVNSGRAFDQLKAAFGNDWEAVRTAPLEAIKVAIRPAGMYNQKAPHIVATLNKLHQDRGEYSLDFLAQMPVAAALAYLMSFPGVGHKTASIVLLFCFNQAAFPVDTHIQRISQRLGISSRRAGAEQIKRIWESLLPAQSYYPLHLNLIRLGREICRAQTPRCEQCPLQQLCDFYKQRGAWRWNPLPPDQAPPE
ncbi:MAG: Fe-S cluster assembly protein HesB [Chloroflexi bacterium]|nr:MAG: Fe-S cluster assembly protein HesB [Chloroflexota bacterium]